MFQGAKWAKELRAQRSKVFLRSKMFFEAKFAEEQSVLRSTMC